MLPDSHTQWSCQRSSWGEGRGVQEHRVDQHGEKGLLLSMVKNSSHTFWQVFRLEGSDDSYLFVKPGWVSWSIWSSLKAEEVYIDSGSLGQACPAHPRNAFNLQDGSKDWNFNKADGNNVESDDWEDGGVAIHCSVHKNWLQT